MDSCARRIAARRSTGQSGGSRLSRRRRCLRGGTVWSAVGDRLDRVAGADAASSLITGRTTDLLARQVDMRCFRNAGRSIASRTVASSGTSMLSQIYWPGSE